MKINSIKNNAYVEKDLLGVLTKLEKLDLSWSKQVPKDYKIWTPHNEIRLWSVPRNTGKLLMQFVMKTRAKTILELGTSAGYSTLWLARGAKQNNGKVYTIELDETKTKMARKNFVDGKMSENIIQIYGNIDDEIERWNKPIDFVFFDSEKTKYLTYLKRLLPYLSPKGIIVADDAVNYADMMPDFLEFVQKNKDLDSILCNIDHGLLVISKKQSSHKNYLSSIMKDAKNSSLSDA